jgi:hypothetical protein
MMHVRGGECDWPGSDLGITLEDAEQVGDRETHYGGGCHTSAVPPRSGNHLQLVG